GELHSRFTFQPGEVKATIDVLTFCSRSLPCVVIQELRVAVDGECTLTITAKVDPTGIDGRWLARETSTPDSDKPVVDGSLLWETHGALATCGAAYITGFEDPHPDPPPKGEGELGGDGGPRRREGPGPLAPPATADSRKARAGRRYGPRPVSSPGARQV